MDMDIKRTLNDNKQMEVKWKSKGDSIEIQRTLNVN